MHFYFLKLVAMLNLTYFDMKNMESLIAVVFERVFESTICLVKLIFSIIRTRPYLCVNITFRTQIKIKIIS